MSELVRSALRPGDVTHIMGDGTSGTSDAATSARFVAMTTPIINAPPNAPLRAQAARKRYAAARLDAKAADLRAQADALDAEAARRKQTRESAA